jgi:ADP-ribosyl-[dinitrogen reductase] hydrolase
VSAAIRTNDLERAIVGCLLGTAVGDAMGLCCEGLSKQRQQRLYPNLNRYHLIFGRGMVSDDTEHACMTAQAVIVAGGDPSLFARSLGRQLRWWLLGIPAGIGYATLRAILKLWLGYSPDRSGVYSAGNGPAMRSALLGVCYGDDPATLRSFVRASTRLTHTDPKAEYGALAVAVAGHLAHTRQYVTPTEYRSLLKTSLNGEGDDLLDLVSRAADSVATGQSTEQFASDLGLSQGVTGYVYQTVPVALHAWLSHQTDFRTGVLGAIRCGGDTDTVAAITGGIVGAAVGKEGIPAEWRNALMEWPRTPQWMERLGGRLARGVAEGQPQSALALLQVAVLPRNLLFLCAVLFHGLRRLYPPY